MSILLSLSGWKELDDESYRNMNKYKRSVMVFPHTSRIEFLIYVIYFFRYDSVRRRGRMLMNPYFMKNFGSILTYFGCIESTPIENRNAGGCDRLISNLEKYEEFTFCISPKGTIYNKPWKSGYYYIAKHFDCPITPAGFDYNEHKFVIKEPIFIGEMTEEQCTSKLQDELKDIVPLNPELSEFRLNCIHRFVDPMIFPLLNSSIIILTVIIMIGNFIFIIFSRHFGSEDISTIDLPPTYI